MMHRLLLGLAVLIALSAGLWSLGVTTATADERAPAAATDTLAVAHHADASTVTLRSRLPVPGTVIVHRSWSAGSPAAARTRDGWTSTSHRHAPLYALLNAYRL